MSSSVNYPEKAQELIAELKAARIFKVEVAKVNKPVAGYTKDSLPLSRIIVPSKLLNFYDQCDGLHIAWREKKKNGETSYGAAGEIDIVPLTQTFIVHWKNKLWYDWMDTDPTPPGFKEQYILAKAIKGFDVMDVLLDGTVIIALLLPEEQSDNEADITLYYWDKKGIKFPIALPPSGYITKSLECCGLMGWQLFHIAFDKVNLKKVEDWEMFGKLFYIILQPMESFVADFARLFPERMNDFFEKQLEVTRQYGRTNGLIK